MIIKQSSVFLIIITRIFKLFVLNKILKYKNIFTFIKGDYFNKSNIKTNKLDYPSNNIKNNLRLRFLVFLEVNYLNKLCWNNDDKYFIKS